MLSRSPLDERPVGLEWTHLPAAFLSVALDTIGEPREIAGLLWRLTCIKDEAEIARIEINVAGNDRVFGAVQDAISPGMTEIDLWSVIYHAMCDIAGEPIISVRGVVERAGFGGHFPHHSGHAYGLFQQEHPFLIPAERIPLQPGMIVTLEPGIYLPGWGGMRLEGNYVITAAGARRLDRFPSELIVC